MIKINNLKKQYNREIVLDIDQLSIPRGECFGLVGNNGAGKTTLFRLILDLVRPSEGEVHIEGKNVQLTEEWKKAVGSYLDEHMLLSYLSADEYFELLRKLYNMSQEDLNQHLEKFEPLFNGEITGNKKYIRDLSKGNVKKVGIASAMMSSKQIVMLDEPFENLDPTSQNRLKKIISEEKQNKQITFLISSHDLTHVTDICDRIVLLEKGLVKQDLKAEKEAMVQALDEYFNV